MVSISPSCPHVPQQPQYCLALQPLSTRREVTVSALQPSASVSSDWLAAMIFNARAISAAADAIPLPYVKGVLGTAVFLLETVDKVQKNREGMKELCADTVDIINVVRDRISVHTDTAAIQFKAQCEELER
ncbi:hypothetical protein B0H17DRAFT_1194073 [Mycena rosella]|uniref:Uncharacterized protein n=1 Tax=Mycena rosella TaxID=1033263 RepID=A0AAD7DZR5_MYCRO|nr:hypothetical protein B0H17DRAFT_1194073 [Mycena rosella]